VVASRKITLESFLSYKPSKEEIYELEASLDDRINEAFGGNSEPLLDYLRSDWFLLSDQEVEKICDLIENLVPQGRGRPRDKLLRRAVKLYNALPNGRFFDGEEKFIKFWGKNQRENIRRVCEVIGRQHRLTAEQISELEDRLHNYVHRPRSRR
jgi:hypothetical protein